MTVDAQDDFARWIAAQRSEAADLPGARAGRDVFTSLKQFELDDYPATSQCLTPNTVFSSTGLIEITRGCKWPCRFCIARTIYDAWGGEEAGT